MNREVFVLLAALAGPAYGEDMLLFSNGLGGIAIMTDQTCEPNGNIVKSTDSRGVVTQWGCSTMVAQDLAKVRWGNGGEAYFNMSWGTPTEAFNRRVYEATLKAKAPGKRASR